MDIFKRTKHERPGAESQTCGSPQAAVTATTTMNRPPTQSSQKQQIPKYVELGTIDYVNLTKDGRHGDYDIAIAVAQATGKPIFANFVEWSG
jgi:hypothetical protein